jgi:Putative collagen-binding domain of a collagenase
LAYEEFDDTPDNDKGWRKSWSSHIQDFRDGDPTWSGGRGKGIIGAINYLADMGLNVFSFLTMNINGDDKNVFPYVSSEKEDRTRIDVSKTAQWEVLMEHADKLGLFLHFKLQEYENDQLLDGGALGLERRLYFRELIARFGHHLALNWNMGEENTNTHEERMAFGEFFHNTDPYQHPVVVHTVPDGKNEVYGPLLQENNSYYVGASLQIGDPATVFDETLFWLKESEANNQKWVVSNDEQGPWKEGVLSDEDDPDHDGIRSNVLWGNIMAGGSGVEFYFGFQKKESDLTCENFRTRAIMFDQTRHALDFFQSNKVPFWDMANENQRLGSSSGGTSSNWCLAQKATANVLVVYLIRGGTDTIDLDHDYTSKWYNPKTGGAMMDGQRLAQGNDRSLGNPPGVGGGGQDWVVLLERQT